MGLGVPELLIVLALVVFLFGARSLPNLAKSIGASIKELRNGVGEDD